MLLWPLHAHSNAKIQGRSPDSTGNCPVKREGENIRKTPDGNTLLGEFIARGICRLRSSPVIAHCSFELNRQRLTLHHHRPRQPARIQRKVVNAAEENIRRGRAGVQHL